ncbi:diacylglycerol kinase family protein [Candidatus Daviesbacteria bacterium]|nr:diacylglycerol kinase family protein [Candidatus Daviesbacteria bacterium]
MGFRNPSNSKILSFKYALVGIATALKEEPNMKFHFFVGLTVIVASVLFGISKQDWIAVIFLIGFVISLELTNTAIEAVVDAFTDREHPGAKLAKDIAAGAVLIAAATSAILGFIIFIPYIRTWIM